MGEVSRRICKLVWTAWKLTYLPIPPKPSAPQCMSMVVAASVPGMPYEKRYVGGRTSDGFRPITHPTRSPVLNRQPKIPSVHDRCTRTPLLYSSSLVNPPPPGMLGQARESQSSTIDTSKHAPVRFFKHATPGRRQWETDWALIAPGLNHLEWQGKRSISPRAPQLSLRRWPRPPHKMRL